MNTKGIEVLVVDDSGMNRKLFSMLLKKMGNAVDEADSGAECLKMICQKKYDLIFMDHMMPEMDGIETLNRMKYLEQSLNRGTPVAALTANDLKGGKEFYLDAGFNGYLEKPVIPQKLEELIQVL